MKCVYCGKEIEDDSKFCVSCGNPIVSNAKRICPKCNDEIELGSRFCNKCGWDIEKLQERTRKCPRCGTPMEKSAKYCLKCGYNSSPKKNSTAHISIVLVIIVLVCGIGGTGVYLHQKAVREAYEAELEAERQRQESIHAYQAKAIELYNAINTAKSNFYVLSSMFSTSTQMNTGLLGPSFYTSYVEGLCSSELAEEKTRKRTIDDLYTTLNEIDCNEMEISELKIAIEDYYAVYCDRYDLLVNLNFEPINYKSKEKTSKSQFDNKFSTVQDSINKIDREVLNDNSQL